MQNITVENSYIDIINEFRSLVDFINYDEVLYEKMFEIISNHFEFEATGIFFNRPDALKLNTLQLYLKNTNLDSKGIETKFFNNMSKFKQIINHEAKAHYFERNTKNTNRPRGTKYSLSKFQFAQIIGQTCGASSAIITRGVASLAKSRHKRLCESGR